MTPAFSVVVPFFNEEANVLVLLAEIDAAMTALGGPWELIMVDDASTDGTPALLAAAAASRPTWHHLAHAKNQGQAAALDTGLQMSRGEIVVTMDGDGQNDPADIGTLVELLPGADMVVGIRADRQDSWLRRAMSRLANKVRGRLLGDELRDSGCALKVFRREVIESFLPIKTLYSFMPALAKMAGFRLAERSVAHRPRGGGESSYGLGVFLWRPLVDLLGLMWYRRRSFSRNTIELAAGPIGDRSSGSEHGSRDR